MPIMFNSILSSCGVMPGDVRLLRHKDTRSAKGRTPYELWRDKRPEFERYQSMQGENKRAALNAPYWASFIGTPDGETLFIGLYSASLQGPLPYDVPKPHMDGIEEAGSLDVYVLSIQDELSEFIGKLLIDWGGAALSWVQRADNQNKPIIELRPKFKEPEFPGFLSFIQQLSQLAVLPVSWKHVLSSSGGIYLLTCPRTKEQYVGSATGEGGFWQRWSAYIADGHGSNLGLQSRDPSDYQVSILEVAGSAATREEILAMETRWKEKLQSREMGLNRN